ncbi:alpha/beta-hydrolase [Setomelanomma holmii]|uniref:Alpha/beta-hydrolase n=1 Tax=Setomelanomma holmii TaxID=210430 RepID=A0A9P4LMU9_9PLEO|nr:alpha/beta-hydrolase [Setomelanomma holmii]
MSSKPFILLVPGSFAPPTIYDKTIAHLRAQGYQAVALRLPSTVKRMPLEPASMTEDADVIRRAAETVISQGKEVAMLISEQVVCHSYGGTPTSQGLAGVKVKRVIYLSAIVPKVGQNQISALGMPGDALPMEAVGGYMHIDPVGMAFVACNDLPWDLAYENVLNFSHHSGPSFLEKVTQVAYKDVPVSYILCEDDLIVNPEAQKGFIKVIEEESGRKVDVVGLKAGHCPNWSMPEKLGDVIVAEAEKA